MPTSPTPEAHTYTLAGTTPLDFEAAVTAAREALAQEGFGVLSEIDVQKTLQAKLGAELEPYLILGACSPPDALRALELEPELGALLPCNVIVHRRDGQTRVAAVDPEAMLGLVDNPQLHELAGTIRTRLARAMEAVWNAGP
jgi:uncharacterized protein (DUF302 family)